MNVFSTQLPVFFASEANIYQMRHRSLKVEANKYCQTISRSGSSLRNGRIYSASCSESPLYMHNNTKKGKKNIVDLHNTTVFVGFN